MWDWNGRRWAAAASQSSKKLTSMVKNRHHHWISMDFHGRIPLSPKNLPQLPRDAEIEDLNLISCEPLPTLITARSVGVEVSGRAVQYSSAWRCKDKKGEKKEEFSSLVEVKRERKCAIITRIEIKRQKKSLEVSSHHKEKLGYKAKINKKFSAREMWGRSTTLSRFFFSISSLRAGS